MNYVPYHLKYRPMKLNDVVGQDGITTILKNSIISNRIIPVLFLEGSRGTGKTTTARIYAKNLNCLAYDSPTINPCEKCENCIAINKSISLDVSEIDAASQSGVENVRTLIENSQYIAINSRYKVVIIDECHMLSNAAYNALLKTIEEPPPNVIFILATTDPNKVLSTVRSRCIQFNFKRIEISILVQYLRQVADIEKINISNESLTFIAQFAKGGLRDCLVQLDKLSLLDKEITPKLILDTNGCISEEDLLDLIRIIKINDYSLLKAKLEILYDTGKEPQQIIIDLCKFMLVMMIAKKSPEKSALADVSLSTFNILKNEVKNWEFNEIIKCQSIFKDFENNAKNNQNPKLWLDITLIELFTNIPDKQQFLINTDVLKPISEIKQPEIIDPVEREKIIEYNNAEQAKRFQKTNQLIQKMTLLTNQGFNNVLPLVDSEVVPPVELVEVKEIVPPVELVEIKEVVPPVELVEIKEVVPPVELVEVKEIVPPVELVEIKEVVPPVELVEVKEIVPPVELIEIKEVVPFVELVEVKEIVPPVELIEIKEVVPPVELKNKIRDPINNPIKNKNLMWLKVEEYINKIINNEICIRDAFYRHKTTKFYLVDIKKDIIYIEYYNDYNILNGVFIQQIKNIILDFFKEKTVNYKIEFIEAIK